jgi:hypothetical protein
VLGGEQRVHAAAGADVERRVDPPPGRERVQEAGGGGVVGDVLGRVLVGPRVAVCGDEQLVDGDDSRVGDDVASHAREGGLAERFEAAGAECALRVVPGCGELEEEHADDGRELRVREPTLERRHVICHARVRVVAEQLGDAVLVVAEAAQCVAEDLRRVRHRRASCRSTLTVPRT